jgi:hypothetical protein
MKMTDAEAHQILKLYAMSVEDVAWAVARKDGALEKFVELAKADKAKYQKILFDALTGREEVKP